MKIARLKGRHHANAWLDWKAAIDFSLDHKGRSHSLISMGEGALAHSTVQDAQAGSTVKDA